MTSVNEFCLVETYAKERFTGQGRIVDLGCWYGATTVSLARGLRHNTVAQSHRRIDALDRFIWEEWMDPFVERVSLPKRYSVGQSFYDDVKKLLAPYDDLVNVEQCDLLEYTPPSAPIEFLFVDAMKNWKLAQKIVSGFFPHLIPGEAYVVQQDFAYCFSEMATNHLIMWQLRDFFRPVHHVPFSSSVVFECVKAVDTAALPDFDPGSFTPEMVEHAYEYSVECVSPKMRPLVEVAKLNFLIEQNRYDEARTTMTRLTKAHRRLDSVLLRAVEQSAGQANQRDAHVRWRNEIQQWVARMR